MADDETGAKHLDTLATILLAIAAVATAWSSYQSAHWRSEQAAHTARSISARIQSSEASTRGGQLTQVDIATFTQWVNATVDGDSELADFYEARFRDEFKPAFAAWLAEDPLTNPDAPPTPFAMDEYVVAENTKATELNAEATKQSTEAAESLTRADDYMLGVVLFAVSLFFAGISTKLRRPVHRAVLLGVGMVIFLTTFVWITTLPKFV